MLFENRIYTKFELFVVPKNSYSPVIIFKFLILFRNRHSRSYSSNGDYSLIIDFMMMLLKTEHLSHECSVVLYTDLLVNGLGH